MKAYDKILAAADKDPEIFCERGKEDSTFGNNPDYLLEVHNITKSDLIRLERAGLATKARYVQKNRRNVYAFKDAQDQPVLIDGPHRVRWLLFKKESE